jgi:hypothetical protein
MRRAVSRSRPAGRVVEGLVLVLAREDRARIAAAHRDDDVCGADELVREWLRGLLGDLHPDL